MKVVKPDYPDKWYIQECVVCGKTFDTRKRWWEKKNEWMEKNKVSCLNNDYLNDETYHKAIERTGNLIDVYFVDVCCSDGCEFIEKMDREMEARKHKPRCKLCGGRVKLLDHHTSYSKNKTIKICYSCHRRIHNPRYSKLKDKLKALEISK